MSKQGAVGVLKSVDAVLFKSVKVLCIVLLASIVLTVTVSVFTRFVIFYPLNFADALAKYLMMWMAFLGMGLAIKAGEHIVVDMFVSKITGRNKKVLMFMLNVLTSVFLIAIIYFGFINAWSGKGSHDPFVFGISMMIPYLSVPVGALYALIQLNMTTFIRLLSEEG